MNMSGTIVILHVDGSTTEKRWEKRRGPPNWETLRDAVDGGYIEHVRVRWAGKVRDAYVDEDGISRGLPVNNKATAALAEPFIGNTLLGPCAIWIPDPKR
jgi:hypothetical protein